MSDTSGYLYDDGDTRKAGHMPKIRETEELSFTYKGAAVSDGSIDLVDYGNALLGFSKMVQAAASEVAPDASVAEVRISKTEKGSFTTIVTLTVDVSFIEAVKSFFLSEYALAIGSAGALGSTVYGAVQIVKWLRSREFIVKDNEDGKTSTLITGDGEQRTAPTHITNLTINNYFREGVQTFVEPTKAEGVDSVTLDPAKGSSSDPVELNAQDQRFFDRLDKSTGEIIQERAILNIERVAFDTGSWRFSQEPTDDRIPTEFNAEVVDEHFMNQVHSSREFFRAGDKLEVSLEIEIPPPNERRRRRYRVTEVHSIIRQDALPGL